MDLNNSTDLDALLAEAEAARADFDASVATCEAAVNAGFVPSHTIVMQGRTLAPQDASPVPGRFGRQQFSDPTDPLQIHAIARRMPVFVVWDGLEIGPVPFTRIKAQLLACKRRANPLNARIVGGKGEERLVLGL